MNIFSRPERPHWDSIETEEGAFKLDPVPTGASPTARFWFHHLIKSVQQSADYQGCQVKLALLKKKKMKKAERETKDGACPEKAAASWHLGSGDRAKWTGCRGEQTSICKHVNKSFLGGCQATVCTLI